MQWYSRVLHIVGLLIAIFMLFIVEDRSLSTNIFGTVIMIMSLYGIYVSWRKPYQSDSEQNQRHESD